jgi:hypothetical protein
MSNWIRNSLTVDKDFNCIKEYCGSDKSPLDFQKILPCPYPMDVLISSWDATEENWYNWCNKNWGTKWQPWEVEALENGFSFITAWDPPWVIIGQLMHQFPEVTFTLHADDISHPCNGYWDIVVRNDQIITGSLDKQNRCATCREENIEECRVM